MYLENNDETFSIDSIVNLSYFMKHAFIICIFCKSIFRAFKLQKVKDLPYCTEERVQLVCEVLLSPIN